MKYIHIPGTDLEVSSICLGTGSMGSSISQQDSFMLLDTFFTQGGNFLDSAKIYADWLPIERSISEKTIGKWMRLRGNRNKVVIGTKGAHPNLDTMHIQRLSPQEITSDLEASLSHLGVDEIDIYWLHRDDPNRPVEEIIETLNHLSQMGKIRYYGCSNWRLKRLKAAQAYAQVNGMKSFIGNQMLWSLAKVDMDSVADKTLVNMDAETWKFHQQTGLMAVPYSSQAGGLFTKIASGNLAKMGPGIKSMYPSEENKSRIERILSLARSSGLSITHIVLGYLLSAPFPTVPIIGCHTLEQLSDSLSAADVVLGQEQMDILVKDKF